VIKTEVEIALREMDCYVAPTFINLENPTFWIPQRDIGLKQGVRSNNRDSFGGSDHKNY